MKDIFSSRLLSLLDNLDYCVLHSWEQIENGLLVSDVDVAMSKRSFLHLLARLKEDSRIRLLQILRHEATCYYIIFEFSLEDGKRIVVPLDVALDYRRDGWIWISWEEVSNFRKRWKGFWVASEELELKYLLIKKALKGNFPEHSLERIRFLIDSLGNNAISVFTKLFGREWGKFCYDVIRDGKQKELQQSIAVLRKELKKHSTPSVPVRLVKYWIPELFRRIERVLFPTGLWIVFLGPDGVGKSSIVNEIQKELGKVVFRKSICFHFIPLLFRKKSGSNMPVTNPHGKRPWPFWISIIKLIYIGVSCWFFYFRDIFWRKRRSYLILSDRYYHDVLVDPIRYRYGGPLFWVKLFSFLVPQPDLYIILDASEEVILERKREVPIQELRRQRKGYLQLSRKLQGRDCCCISTEDSLGVVKNAVKEIIFSFLNRRIMRTKWMKKRKKE